MLSATKTAKSATLRYLWLGCLVELKNIKTPNHRWFSGAETPQLAVTGLRSTPRVALKEVRNKCVAEYALR